MRLPLAKHNLPLAATVVVCGLLYLAAGLTFENFFSWAVLINLIEGNSVLGVVAVGMTFVIISGGIDLSVGAVLGCASILLAHLIEHHHVPALVAVSLVLILGAVFGSGMGLLISRFALPPFLVTLAGMFLARGLGFVVSFEAQAIRHPFYKAIPDLALPLGESESLPAIAWIFLLVLAAGIYVSLVTRFGRNTYALGGNEHSAVLMGLPVARTKVAIYALSGFCSALAGILYTFNLSAGDPTAGMMLELDAITAVVIGGTLLSGGVGQVAGTLMGVLIFGIIQTITMQASLDPSWTKIVIGLLLLIFILLQKLVQWKL